jgi:type II secretory pathway pseudopilin PulG
MTLIEMLIAMGISAVVIGGLTAGIYAIMDVTGRGNAEITALRDIQSASYWISNDAQMAREAILAEGEPATGLTLEWDDSTGSPHTSSYTLTDTELVRNYDDILTTVAWNVSSVEFTVNADVLTYTVLSAPPGRWNVSRKVTGQVNLRAYQ